MSKLRYYIQILGLIMWHGGSTDRLKFQPKRGQNT